GKVRAAAGVADRVATEVPVADRPPAPDDVAGGIPDCGRRRSPWSATTAYEPGPDGRPAQPTGPFPTRRAHTCQAGCTRPSINARGERDEQGSEPEKGTEEETGQDDEREEGREARE